jgi:S-formylglutathione hydrolase FrmB
MAVAALLAVAAGVWLLLRPGAVLGPVDRHGARVEHLSIDSSAVGQQLPVSVVVPKGGSSGPRGLLVFLHGRGQDEDTLLDSETFSALSQLGDKAPVIAFPYGGDHSYWHDRADGDWGTYVTDEVIPAVEKRVHSDPARVAIGGISMGGFGAYDLALLNPGGYCAVGGHSPALWQSAEETAPGAFDDAEDFDAHNVIAGAQSQPTSFTGQPVWLDAGDDDPFVPGDQAFTAALSAAGAPLVERHWPGGHDEGYWNAHWDAYLRFYANALNRCGQG